MYVIEIIGGPGEDCDAVLNVEYYISEYFTNDTFDSCKEVKLPSLGIPVSGLVASTFSISYQVYI